VRVHVFCFSRRTSSEILDLQTIGKISVLGFQACVDDLAENLFSLVRVIVKQ